MLEICVSQHKNIEAETIWTDNSNFRIFKHFCVDKRSRDRKRNISKAIQARADGTKMSIRKLMHQ